MALESRFNVHKRLMALATDLTLNAGSYGGTAGDAIFSEITQSTLGTKTRRVSSTATTAPETLSISHREQKGHSGAYLEDQHLLRIDKEITDANFGKVKAAAWLVIKMPKGTSYASSDIKTLVGRLLSAYMAAGAADKILNSES